MYAQQKSSHDLFFDENDKPDRKSLQQVKHAVEQREREKNEESFYVKQNIV